MTTAPAATASSAPSRRAGIQPPAAPPAPSAPSDRCDPPGQGPLSAEHLAEWAQANQRARKVLGAAKLAAFNGWSCGIFAACCLPFALSSVVSGVMGVGLGAVAWNEFRGRKLIRRFDLRGPRALGFNQVGLLGLLVGYGLWQIWTALAGPSPYQDVLQNCPELGTTLGPLRHIETVLTLAVYGAVIALSVVFQGLNAVYYFTRTPALRAYVNQTPAWILAVQRSSAA